MCKEVTFYYDAILSLKHLCFVITKNPNDGVRLCLVLNGQLIIKKVKYFLVKIKLEELSFP